MRKKTLVKQGFVVLRFAGDMAGSFLRDRPPDRESTKKAPTQGIQRPAVDAKPRTPDKVDHRDIPGRLRIEYMHGTRDPVQKALDGVTGLLRHFQKPQINIDELLKEAAELIQRQFGIDNVAIGLRDPRDGLYRYKTLVGFREEAIDGHKRIAYKAEQFYGTSEFTGYDISKMSRLYLDEDSVLTEEERRAYNRPALLTMRRRTTYDSLEGDYLDTKILGPNDKLLGWIEISGTRLMKLPDPVTIRWVEAIASIIAAALISQD